MAATRAVFLHAVRQGRVATRAPLAAAQAKRVATPLARWSARSASRAFSSKGVNGVNGLNGLNGEDDDWESEDHGDVSPFERLLQHSKRFRDGAALDDQPEHFEDESLDEPELLDDDEQLQDDDDEPKRDGGDDDDLEAVLDEREGDHAEFVGQIRKPHGHHHHHDHDHDERGRYGHNRDRHQRDHTRASKRAVRWGVEQRVRRQIGGAEDVDFEHGLRDLDERRAREKMYLQLLARDYDRDRVCQNCGEPGHVARNCMLPVICSNCGDVGHRRGECPHRAFSVEQLAAVKPVKQKTAPGGRKKSESQLKAEARRRVELQAIRERHERMKQAFDDEMDEYLDHYERAKKAREDNARKAGEEQD